jgi:uncharacterized membrane protein
MTKGRMEAFSDGVIAILITIMVLELKVPQGEDLNALTPMLPVFLSYILSYVYLGIYWNNHHHLLHATEGVTGGIMWANLHLLFWLSLVPVATAWLGESHNAAMPNVAYGTVLFMAAIAYSILLRTILAAEPRNSRLHRAVGNDTKGLVSLMLYVTAIALAFYNPWMSNVLYAAVALTWLVPDRRIERTH